MRSGTALRRGSGVIPFGFETNSTMSSPTGGWVVAAPIWASKAAFASGAAPIWTPGQRVTTSLPAGVWFGAGAVLPRQSAGTAGALSIRATVVPAGTPFNLFNSANVFLNANVVAPAGALIPVGVNMQPVGGIMQNTRPTQADGAQGRIWAVAPMLQPGSQILVDASGGGCRSQLGRRPRPARRKRTGRGGTDRQSDTVGPPLLQPAGPRPSRACPPPS